jgi:acetyl-CoA C-acetyltransferase/acetyl-CoA acyltransferase
MLLNERIAIVEGIRTPFCKAGGALKSVQADDLGGRVLQELMLRSAVDKDAVDEVIMGNVAQPTHAANIARVSALKAGFPASVPAHTVHRNCASGMQSITTAALQILSGESSIVVAGGTESMSNIPLFYGPQMTAFFERLSRARSLPKKLSALASFRFKHLKPVIGIIEGLTDPVCGLIMGMTAEVLAREFVISREEQDRFALQSHKRATAAIQAGLLAEEMHPVPVSPAFHQIQEVDEGPRDNQTMDALRKLKPYFDRRNGTVTVGNACQLTDGAAAVLMMSESRAREQGLTPLGYLKAFSYGALSPDRMGLGPVISTSRVLDATGMQLSDFDLIEINEAFAAQVLACEKAFGSDTFAKNDLGKDKALGELPMDKLNVNGGAIALGHPVGTTGTRLVLTLLKELGRRDLQTGLASLCIGGGQGAALVLERT